jgi:hypothetical protein
MVGVEGLLIHVLIWLRRVSHEASIIAGRRLKVLLIVPAVRGVVELVWVGSERLLVLCVERHCEDQRSFNQCIRRPGQAELSPVGFVNDRFMSIGV